MGRPGMADRNLSAWRTVTIQKDAVIIEISRQGKNYIWVIPLHQLVQPTK